MNLIKHYYVEIKCQLDATDFHIITTMHDQNHFKLIKHVLGTYAE